MSTSRTFSRIRAIAIALVLTFGTNYAISVAAQSGATQTADIPRPKFSGATQTADIPRPKASGATQTADIPRPTKASGATQTADIPRP